MKNYVMIRCIHDKDHADRWIKFCADGRVGPYSAHFKNKDIEAWLAAGHIVGHKTSPDGMIETWTLID